MKTKLVKSNTKIKKETFLPHQFELNKIYYYTGFGHFLIRTAEGYLHINEESGAIYVMVEPLKAPWFNSLYEVYEGEIKLTLSNI